MPVPNVTFYESNTIPARREVFGAASMEIVEHRDWVRGLACKSLHEMAANKTCAPGYEYPHTLELLAAVAMPPAGQRILELICRFSGRCCLVFLGY